MSIHCHLLLKTVFVSAAFSLLGTLAIAQTCNRDIRKGVRYQENNNLSKANHYFRMASQVCSDPEDLYFVYGSLATNYANSYELDSAIYFFEMAEKFPDSHFDGIFKSNLAYVYWQRDFNMAKSLQLLNEAIELDSTDSEFYLNRGFIYSDMNDNIKACQDFQKAREMGNRTARMLFEDTNCESWFTPENLKKMEDYKSRQKAYRNREIRKL